MRHHIIQNYNIKKAELHSEFLRHRIDNKEQNKFLKAQTNSYISMAENVQAYNIAVSS